MSANSLPDGAAQSHCQRFGFADDSARQQRLSQVGLCSDDFLGPTLQKRVITPYVQEILDRFYAHLWEQPDAKKILQSLSRISRLKSTQRDYLLSIGLAFDQERYFESRLRVGIAHRRIGLPLALYQTSYGLLQQILLDLACIELRDEPVLLQKLTRFIVLATTLDMSLAIESYRIDEINHWEHRVESLERESKTLRVEVETDALTGAASRRSVLGVLKQMLAQHTEPLTIIIGDIDLFKGVNDRYGHIAGDAVLAEVVTRFRSALRRTDVLGRYGGDELLAVLSNTDATAATIIAERVRNKMTDAIQLKSEGVERSLTVSLTLGVAQATHSDSPSTLIHRADDALYRMKRAGRNAVGTDDGKSEIIDRLNDG